MSASIDQLGLYLHLARASGMRRQMLARDRMLILAGAQAAQLDLPQVAAYCRREVMRNNPGHMIRRWDSFSEALSDSDFQHFFQQVQRRYPLEKAERMLDSLGIDMARERQTYYSDEEYAAALLGVTPDQLDELLGEESD